MLKSILSMVKAVQDHFVKESASDYFLDKNNKQEGKQLNEAGNLIDKIRVNMEEAILIIATKMKV